MNITDLAGWTMGFVQTSATLAQGVMLMSPWKPFLFIIPFIPWALMVSKVFDKHAGQFFLAREAWNLAHLVVAMVALAVGVGLPAMIDLQSQLAVWIGWAAMIVILFADLVVFIQVTNRDERVPETKQLSLMDFSKFKEAQAAKADVKKQGKSILVIKGPDKQVLSVPDAETPEFEVRNAGEQVYLKAESIRASQIDIAPVPNAKEPTYSVSFLVDGLRQSGDTLAAVSALKLIDFWKSAGKLDLNERRKKQTADVIVEHGETRHKLRVQTSGSQGGMRATMLFDPEAAVKRKNAELGLLEPQMGELKAITGEEKGVVLVAGLPDGGRTTTLYAITRMHDAYTKNVQTVELETQDSIEGVRQNVWEAVADGPEFSTLVRSILRRDPAVLSVAELPDQATAKEIAKADHERTRTYVGLRSDGAPAAIATWTKAVGETEAASKCLQGVIAHRLIRKLCNNCKVAYQPSPDMVKKLGLPPDRVKQLFKKGGQVLIKNKPEICPACNGVGYFGQEAVWEVYKLSDDDRALVRKGDLATLFKVEMRKRGVPTLQQVALRKAVDGLTSVEELARLSGEGSSQGGAGSATPPASSPPKPPAPAKV
jgi:type II secretory ATPase GspE/PulE/Tfp pilus assembly ATPase PilB-like protein